MLSHLIPWQSPHDAIGAATEEKGLGTCLKLLGQFQNDLIHNWMQKLCMRVRACVKQGGTVYKEETRLTSGKHCLTRQLILYPFELFLLLDSIYLAQAVLELAG